MINKKLFIGCDATEPAQLMTDQKIKDIIFNAHMAHLNRISHPAPYDPSKNVLTKETLENAEQLIKNNLTKKGERL